MVLFSKATSIDIPIGIYLVTFFSCMRVLLWRDGQFKSWEAVNKMMVLSALLMLVFGTLDVSFGLLQNLEAFIYQAAKGITPEEEFGKISKWSNVMKFANYAAQTFIGDGILVSDPSLSTVSFRGVRTENNVGLLGPYG